MLGGRTEIILNIQEQGYDDVLLDLGSQVFVTEEIHCKEKNIACRLLVSVLPTEDLLLKAIRSYRSACWRIRGNGQT